MTSSSMSSVSGRFGARAPDQAKQYGLLLPHFGASASRERIVGGSVQAEDYGFDSVWVRDHLVYHPHNEEGQNRTFVDPIVALSAIAAATRTITLGTGALIPHRHPIHTALLLASLDLLAGPGRIITGWGLGGFDHEFEVIGLGACDRRELLREQIEIFRKLWSGEPVSHNGQYYEFRDVDIHPTPSDGGVPIWYCGSSAAAVRRAVEYCDGWMPGRMPRYIYAQRFARMRATAEQRGRDDLPDTGVIPWVSPGKTVEDASAMLNVPQLIGAFTKSYGDPPNGPAGNVQDLDGWVIAGTPDRIVEEVRGFQEMGARHFVFDLRARFDDWEDCIALLGEEVLPELKRGDTPASHSAHEPS